MTEVLAYQEQNDRAPKTWPDQQWVDPKTGETITLPPQTDDYVFGNPDYPIAKYRDLIVDTVNTNPVTVLASGTGNGKSISVVQYLYETGRYRHIIQTQPRVAATRENERFTLQQMSEAAGRDMSDVIAYRTAVEGDAVRGTHVIREHTDGYLLQQLLAQDEVITRDDVLIIDEAHERNPNIDIAIGVALKKGLRLVIQSASMDTDKWAQYCSQALDGRSVPVLDLPGVMHPVERKVGGLTEEQIISYANLDSKEPMNIAAIVPGKREIGDTIGRITNRVPKDYTILPLHAEQSIEEQRRAMESYPGGKIIVATDVLRQSITVPDLDVVVDPMYARSGDYVQGIRYLRVHPVSKANVIQGSGRVGRTKPGIYAQALLENYPPVPRNEAGEPLLDSHDKPPILRTDLAPFVLRLGRTGLRLDQLDLQDMPRANELEYAHHKLVRLGAQVLNSFEATRIGEEMARLPLDPTYARMFIESQKHGRAVEMQMAALVAATQQEGITRNEQGCERWRTLSKENRSDMLVQLDVLVQALSMTPVDLKQFDIIDRRLVKAKRLFERLTHDRDYSIGDIRIPTENERQKLIACMIAGADKLFVNYGPAYTDGASFSGRLAKSSSISHSAQLVIGSGLGIEHYRNGVKKTHSVITNATIVTPEQLVEHAPWRCTYGEGRVSNLCGYGNTMIAGRDLYFDGHATGTVVQAEPSVETTKVVLEAMLGAEALPPESSDKVHAIFSELQRIKELLVDRSSRADEFDVFVETLRQSVSTMKDVKVMDMHSLAEVMYRRGMYEGLKLSYGLESADTQKIMDQSPDSIVVSMGDELVEVGVRYRNNEAFIDVPVHRIKELSDYGITDQLGDRSVHVWMDKGQTHRKPLHEAVACSNRGNRTTRRSRRVTK